MVEFYSSICFISNIDISSLVRPHVEAIITATESILLASLVKRTPVECL